MLRYQGKRAAQSSAERLEGGLGASANDYNATALFNAILKSRVPLLGSLLKSGIDSNVRNTDGMTPLMAAASIGNIEIIRLLLAKGADAAATNGLGETAADIAARSGHTQAASLLVSARSRPAAQAAPRPAGRLAKPAGGFAVTGGRKHEAGTASGRPQRR